ncbi:MAG: anti-sigma factor [Pseudomonadota bacterium]|nr:anti-sigma factor [Pseudomonadota bacterium]
MDYSRPQLADRLAAEYVSGLLRGPARQRFEALLPAHPTLRGAVREWQDRLMPLTAAIEPRPPSPAVWRRIEARLWGSGSAIPTAGAWWRGLAFWRGFSAIAGVAAVALGVLLTNPAPTRPPIVVVLAAAPAPGSASANAPPPSFVASISADGQAMVTRPLTNVSMQAGHSLELWSLPPSGAPRSLGVIAADAATVVRREKVLQGTDALAVTLEAAGGSPDGKPHGPVLYVGKLVL